MVCKILDYMAVGKKSHTRQKTRNATQEELAEKIWISTAHMSHIETGSNTDFNKTVFKPFYQELV